jgi:triacylglycerol lipase
MHPIVLAHGFFGFAQLGSLTYFKGVEKHLKKKFPGITILITEVEPNDLIKDRAQQLWDQVKKLNEKVHIIGHSMGGLDSRFMISPQGLNKAERVISLTTLSSPHHGSPVAQFIIDRVEMFNDDNIEHLVRRLPTLTRIAKKIIKKMRKRSEVWRYLLELFSFSEKGMTNLTPAFLKEFNQKYLDAPGVKYFSYAGVTGPGEKDYLPELMYLHWAIVYLSKDEQAGGRNDGLGAVESSKWGTFKGEVQADHFKMVGHDLSTRVWLRKLLPFLPCLKPFDHLKLFEQIVKDLQELEED